MFEIYLSDNPQDVQQGRLWRITAPNSDQHSYMLGSLHVDGLRDGTPELNYLFRNSSSFLFEMPDENRPFDSSFELLQAILRWPKYQDIPEKIKNLMTAYPDWQNNLAKQAHNEITRYYQHAKQTNPYSVEYLKQLNPFVLKFISTRITIPFPTLPKESVFDSQLFASARRKKEHEGNNILVKSVEELEDCLVIDLDMHRRCKQDAIRKEFLSKHEQCDAETMDQLNSNQVAAYLAGAYHKLYEPIGYDAIWMRQRNQMMLPKVLPYLSQGKSFFVTGLFHCLGRDGFIKSLQTLGYKVERVYETLNPKIQTSLDFTTSKQTLLVIHIILDAYNYYKSISSTAASKQHTDWLKLLYSIVGISKLLVNIDPDTFAVFKYKGYFHKYISFMFGLTLGKLLIQMLSTPSWKRAALLRSAILHTIDYFYELSNNNKLSNKILKYNAPRGMLEQWKQRAAELYQSLDVDGIADKSVKPVILRGNFLTSYMLRNSATKAKFVNISAPEIERSGPSPSAQLS